MHDCGAQELVNAGAALIIHTIKWVDVQDFGHVRSRSSLSIAKQ